MIRVARNVAGTAADAMGMVVGATLSLVTYAQGAASGVFRRGKSLANDVAHQARSKAVSGADSAADWTDEKLEEAQEKTAELRERAGEMLDEPDRRPYEERTKEELYELAVERDIEGRSTMNKEELIVALREER